MSRSTTSTDVNLLPFQGVLCAVIGILMLLLVAALTTRAVGTLEAGRDGEGGTSGRGETGGIEDAQYAALEEQIRKLNAEFSHRSNELAELRSAAMRLEELIQVRKDAEQLGLTDPEDVYPGLVLRQPTEVQAVPAPGRADKRKPIPLEVTDRGCVIHVRPRAIVVDDPLRNEPVLRSFLEGVLRNRDQQYLLLLVRPNGVETYRRLRTYLEDRFGSDVLAQGQRVRKIKFDLGVEPFDHDWLLVVPEPGL